MYKHIIFYIILRIYSWKQRGPFASPYCHKCANYKVKKKKFLPTFLHDLDFLNLVW